MNFTEHDPNFLKLDFSSFLTEIGLTPRELEVMEWVARGKTNIEIGMILDISPRTASKHLEHIFTKFSVKSRTEAVLHFIRLIQSRIQTPITFHDTTWEQIEIAHSKKTDPPEPQTGQASIIGP